MKSERIVFIVGHTHKFPGASMCEPYSYIQEYEYNTVLAGMLGFLCRDRGIEHKVIFRDSLGLDGAYRAAEFVNPSAIIELHFNAFQDPAVRGCETLYGNIPKSDKLAEFVHQEIISAFRQGKHDRGIKKRESGERGARNLNNKTGIPTIITEPFFGTNFLDAGLALSSIDSLAHAIVDGFLVWTLHDSGACLVDPH